eukprot:3634535-Prymnesium_polylepis.2
MHARTLQRRDSAERGYGFERYHKRRGVHRSQRRRRHAEAGGGLALPDVSHDQSLLTARRA